jgi:hypothetical protein
MSRLDNNCLILQATCMLLHRFMLFNWVAHMCRHAKHPTTRCAVICLCLHLTCGQYGRGSCVSGSQYVRTSPVFGSNLKQQHAQ